MVSSTYMLEINKGFHTTRSQHFLRSISLHCPTHLMAQDNSEAVVSAAACMGQVVYAGVEWLSCSQDFWKTGEEMFVVL